jgi:hypothetical protein
MELVLFAETKKRLPIMKRHSGAFGRQSAFYTYFNMYTAAAIMAAQMREPNNIPKATPRPTAI